jgi:hypothetical protein
MAAPTLDVSNLPDVPPRSDCELPDEELEEAEEEAEGNVDEETNQRRTLKAPSMAAPTLDVSNLPDVPPRSNCELPHVCDQGAGSSGTPSRWLQVSELGSVGIKAAKFGLLNKRKAQQARAVSAMTRK